MLSALLGLNVGIEVGQAAIIVVVFAVRRVKWSSFAHAAAGSAPAAMDLFWLSERVLGG